MGNFKHYHLTAGLRGGYIPHRVEVYSTKREAISRARDLVAEYRDGGDKVRGSEYSSRDGDLVGYWIARQSEVTREFFDYISVRVCILPDCATEDEE